MGIIDKAIFAYPRTASGRADNAVRRCMAAFEAMAGEADARGIPLREAREHAVLAYKLAMPAMDTRPGIQANIACTAAAINLGIIHGREASQLLYAAQVAFSILRKPQTPGKPGRPKKARKQ